VLHHTSAELTELRGWKEDIGECRTLSDLPDAAREYLDFITEHIDVPIAMIGVGPGREQTVWTDSGRDTLIGRRAEPQTVS
jgi:adenylosuccinate synthase